VIQKALQYINDLVKPEVVTVDGKDYSDRSLHPVVDGRCITPVQCHTLEGLARAYDRRNAPWIISIESPSSAAIITQDLNGSLKHDVIARATAITGSFNFGHWMSQEQMLIDLQTNFVLDDALKNITKIIGNVADSAIRTSKDDGVTQELVVKQGVSLKSSEVIVNPAKLRPYRTFHEVEQPASAYVLRAKSAGEQVQFALFAAEGERWQHEAILAIEGWLKERLPEGTEIIM
jgi:hypothetical protein